MHTHKAHVLAGYRLVEAVAVMAASAAAPPIPSMSASTAPATFPSNHPTAFAALATLLAASLERAGKSPGQAGMLPQPNKP